MRWRMPGVGSRDNMNRAENIRRLAQEDFDLCIIGAGASGAGCALDAALRGLKVALVDKGDFAEETSSRSTKLVHGGVRYLEQAFKKLDFAQLRQVRHGLRERRIVLQNAPHLAHPMGIVTPVFSWWEGLYFFIGLKLYDWISRAPWLLKHSEKHPSMPSGRWLGKAEVLKMMPGLSPRIHSAVLYYDGQLDDARYCLALIRSATEAGAVPANHLEVCGFQKNAGGKICAATINDRAETRRPPFQIRAKRFLNCTGPYADHIRQLANPDLPGRISPSKGVHVILPLSLLDSEKAMLIPKTSDGRVIFAIPFEGKLLVGTTDEPFRSLTEEPLLESREVDFLLSELQPFVAQTLEKSQVLAGFGGIRPLLAPHSAKGKEKATRTLLRDHEVEQDPASGLFSLMGGKWTTYRLMARDTTDAVCMDLGLSAVCQTENYPLEGARDFEPSSWQQLQARYGFDTDVCQHLASKYGTNASGPATLAAENPDLAQRIIPGYPYLQAEIVYAAREEMAISLHDFLARRIRLEITDWDAACRAAPTVAKWMGATLGWPEAEQKAKADAYIDQVNRFIQTAQKAPR